MPNTFSQIYLQFVFAVKGRKSLIPKQHKEELHKYITALVQARKAKMLAIHCMPDHIHLFVGFRPSVLISDFVKEIKVESNELLNRKNGLMAILRGRKDTAYFLTDTHKLIEFASMY